MAAYNFASLVPLKRITETASSLAMRAYCRSSLTGELPHGDTSHAAANGPSDSQAADRLKRTSA
jgi:hypothetical protein